MYKLYLTNLEKEILIPFQPENGMELDFKSDQLIGTIYDLSLHIAPYLHYKGKIKNVEVDNT